MPGQSGYAVGWGTLALLNAGLAHAKGRGGLVWSLISLLLGPVATLLIVLLPCDATSVQPLGRAAWLVIVVVVVLLFLLGVFGLATSSGGGVQVGPISL